MSEAATAPVEAPAAGIPATDLTGASTPAPAGDTSSPASGEGEAGQPAGQGAAGEAPNGGDPAAGGKPPGEEGGAAQGAPEAYAAFTLPDGHNADAPWVSELSTYAKAQNLTQEQAQALVDLNVTQATRLLGEFAQANKDSPVMARDHWAQTWSDQTTADSELGGTNLQGTMALTTRVFQTFGTPELGAFLAETGLAHHPELIRFMHKVGKAVSEDVLVVPQGGQAKSQLRGKDNAHKARVLYPNMN